MRETERLRKRQCQRAYKAREVRVGKTSGAPRRAERVAQQLRQDERALAAHPLSARAEAPYEVSELLSIAGYELRSPITPLKIRLQQTRRRLQREGGRERDIDDLSKALYHVERIQQQVALLLDATSLLRGSCTLAPRLSDLSDVARRLADIYASADAGRVIRLEGVDKSLTGLWDSPRLDVALRELVSNALKYTTGDITLRLARRGLYARVEVEDTGPAIPHGLHERIFDPYVTGYQSNHGLGLGLYVAREIVRLHGGKMGMRPTRAGGAIFWFTLPLGVC